MKLTISWVATAAKAWSVMLCLGENGQVSLMTAICLCKMLTHPWRPFPTAADILQVWYDGFEEHSWDGGNYMIGGDVWGLVARRAKGGLWRVTYGDNQGGLTDEEYEARRPAAFEKLLPGHPKPNEYRITQTDHFRIHNRCVEKMRVGRILLAADAAHVNNPFGGYGAMNAIVDVGGLADCLVGLYDCKVGSEILDLYAEIRRDKFLKYVDARSMKNMKRIINPDPNTTLEGDKLISIFRELEGNPEATKDFLLVSIPCDVYPEQCC